MKTVSANPCATESAHRNLSQSSFQSGAGGPSSATFGRPISLARAWICLHTARSPDSANTIARVPEMLGEGSASGRFSSTRATRFLTGKVHSSGVLGKRQFVTADSISKMKTCAKGRPPSGAYPRSARLVLQSVERLERQARGLGWPYVHTGEATFAKDEVLEELLHADEARPVPPLKRRAWAKRTFDRGVCFWGTRIAADLYGVMERMLQAEVAAGRLAQQWKDIMLRPKTPRSRTALSRHARASDGGYSSASLSGSAAPPEGLPASRALLIGVRNLCDAIDVLPPDTDIVESSMNGRHVMSGRKWRKAAALGIRDQLNQVKVAAWRLERELQTELFGEGTK